MLRILHADSSTDNWVASIVSYIGMNTQEVKIAGDAPLSSFLRYADYFASFVARRALSRLALFL